jgi:ERF superfamily
MHQIYSSINIVQKELCKLGISKVNVNKEQKWNFRGIDDVYNTVSSLLAENSIVMIPRLQSREVYERTTKSGSVIFYVTLKAEFDFISCKDNSKVTIETFGEAMDTGDKATNKAMSAAQKYAVIMTFLIPTAGENDPDFTVYNDISSNNNSSLQKNNPIPKKNQEKPIETASIQKTNNISLSSDNVKVIYDRISKMRIASGFKNYIEREFDKFKLSAADKEKLLSLCIGHGEKIGIIYVPEERIWINLADGISSASTH